jgi:hypothetical protein
MEVMLALHDQPMLGVDLDMPVTTVKFVEIASGNVLMGIELDNQHQYGLYMQRVK